MDPHIVPRLARLAALALFALGASSCYFGAGLGGAIPLRAPAPSGPRGVAALEGGFQYDHRRLVRVMAIGSGQLGGGAHFEAGGRVIEAPFGNGFGLDVTVLPRPDYLLRVSARAWPFAQEVALGSGDARRVQPGSRVRTALLGGTLHLLGDEEELGPVGVSLLAGLLVQRVSGIGPSPQWAVAPMVLVGMDWGWKLLHCWFVNEACSQHLLRGKN
jgi:hypothetical protein